MKRITLVTILLFTCSLLFAAKPIKVIKGEMPQFKEGETAIFEIDLSETTWEEKETLKHHFDDYDGLVESMSDIFRVTFNRNSSSVKIKENDSPTYRFVFRPSNFFCRVGTLYKKYTIVWGTFEILEPESENVLCEIEITKFKAKSGDYVEADSVVKCISELAEEIHK